MKVLITMILIISAIMIVFGINLQKQAIPEYITNHEMQKNDSGLEILSRTAQYYNSFNSYKSRGTAEFAETINGKNNHLLKTQFNLTYQSPKDFILDWKDDENDVISNLKISSDRFVLEKNGNPVKEYERINDAVFDASFENGNSRFFILSLLAFNDKFLPTLRNVQRLDDESINGKTHYKIRAEIRGIATDAKVDFIYWIEEKSLIIKKIQRQIVYEGVTKTTTENYSDVEINLLRTAK